MDNDNKQENLYDIPTFELLEKIKNKIIDPVLLPKSTRQACVEVLMVEGHHPSPIATLLKKSDRTIRRDMLEIRQRNAVIASPAFTQMLVGDLINNARNHYEHLKKIARSEDAYPDEQTRAETMAWKVNVQLIDKLYKLGCIMAGHFEAPIKKYNVDDEMTDEQKATMIKIRQLRPMETHKVLDAIIKEIQRQAAEEETKREEAAQNNKEEKPLLDEKKTEETGNGKEGQVPTEHK